MQRRLPLVYFHGLMPGKYLAEYPVFVVGDHPDSLVFDVAVDDRKNTWTAADPDWWASQEATTIRRAYVTAQVFVRVHQRAFRERVLDAYRQQCAFCRLRHAELLEASHISPDSSPEGEPVISNGLALCSLHHKAFDRAFLGLRPDYTIEVRPDILVEKDGPTLAHAIQGMQGVRISLPSKITNRPDPDRVLERYHRFQQLSALAEVKRSNREKTSFAID
jgi:putative restriction endonuclease